MKKLSLMLTLLTGLFLSFSANAQSNSDYLVGKWKVTVFGTPNGNSQMIFVFEKKDGKLSGVVRDSTDKEISKITSIEEAGKTVTSYFSAGGYDVNVALEPVDADNVKGSLMGMFDTKGVRIKEPAKK